MTITELLRTDPQSRQMLDRVDAVIAGIADVKRRVGKSQVGYSRERAFAAAWVPRQNLSGERPPLVLSLYLPRRINSKRWKEVVEPVPGRFTHHLELSTAAQVDEEVARWIIEASEAAG